MSKINRRNFIQKSILASTSAMILPHLTWAAAEEDIVMTVRGPIRSSTLGFTLTHEHILVDFIGAEKYSKNRYDVDEVYNTALPFLKDVKNKGCSTFMDCSPAYLGRDVQLFKRLAETTGLNILTNTGYYGAASELFLPPHVYTESAEQIAARWIKEWTNGIEGTGIKPGFIKTSVDNAPLTNAQRKIIEAAALTHLATGLTIAVHTGNGEAAKEQLTILNSYGVSPSARIWVHAQNEVDKTYHITTPVAIGVSGVVATGPGVRVPGRVRLDLVDVGLEVEVRFSETGSVAKTDAADLRHRREGAREGDCPPEFETEQHPAAPDRRWQVHPVGLRLRLESNCVGPLVDNAPGDTPCRATPAVVARGVFANLRLAATVPQGRRRPTGRRLRSRGDLVPTAETRPACCCSHRP